MTHFAIFLIFLVSYGICFGKEFHLGILAPWYKPYHVGTNSAGAIEIALEDMKTNNATFFETNKAGHEFQYTWVDTQCDPSMGIPAAAQLLYSTSNKNQIDAIIGPWCSTVCEPAGYMAREKHIPVISFGCTLERFSDKNLFPTFARTIGGPDYHRGPAFVKLMKQFNFQRVALFFGPEPWSRNQITSIRDQFIRHNIIITDYLPLVRGDFREASNSITDLKIVRERSRGMIY